MAHTTGSVQLSLKSIETAAEDFQRDDFEGYLIRRMNDEFHDEPIELPIDGVLDLHTFKPREIGDLISDYLAGCRDKGILDVRIIHGKGIGNLQRSVHAILTRHPDVISFATASAHFGGMGATIVRLKPKSDQRD